MVKLINNINKNIFEIINTDIKTYKIMHHQAYNIEKVSFDII